MRSSLIKLMVGGLTLMPAGAWAGGSGTGSGGTGTGTGSDSGPTSTGGAASSDGSCGSCNDPGESVVFVSPSEGDTVPGDLMVSVEVRYACSCDDCGCYEDNPSSFTLSVDGSEVYACFDGCTMTHTVDVLLAPGTHQLSGVAEYSFHSESASISVTVDGEVTTASGSEGGASSGGTGGSGGSGSGSGGGCRIGSAGTTGLALAWLLALGLVRRRSRATRA